MYIFFILLFGPFLILRATRDIQHIIACKCNIQNIYYIKGGFQEIDLQILESFPQNLLAFSQKV